MDKCIVTLRMRSIYFNIHTCLDPEAYLLILLYLKDYFHLLLLLFMLVRLPGRKKVVPKLKSYDIKEYKRNRGKAQFYVQMLRYWWKSLRLPLKDGRVKEY